MRIRLEDITSTRAMNRILSEEGPDMRTFRPDASEPVAQFLVRALHADATRHPRSATGAGLARAFGLAPLDYGLRMNGGRIGVSGHFFAAADESA
jgi:hypothetical protein